MEKIIKKLAKKVAFSFYGILEIFMLLLPFVVVGLGIFFMVSEKGNGLLWIIVGALLLLLTIKKFKEIFEIYRYIFNPKKYPVLKNMINDGCSLEVLEQEIIDKDVLNKLSKKNPVVMTDNFIIGYSQVNFFLMYKPSILWAYEYNGNGIVFYDKDKFYGYTFFLTVDGNDKLMEELKEDLPYIYFGTDFDYKKVMHDELNETIEKVKAEREEFLEDPLKYKEKKALEEKEKALEEEMRLKEEEEKQKALEDGEVVNENETDSSSEEIVSENEENI